MTSIEQKSEHYSLTKEGSIIRASDGATIPPDQNNSDYQRFLAWQAAGGVPDPYVPPPPPLIDPISDRQFFEQLAVQSVITQTEALAAVRTGTLPAALQALINGLPADQQFGAQMILSGATQFYRHHPMTVAFAAAYGWTDNQVDTFWRAAGAL